MVAPTAVTRGFVLACVLGAWLAAWLADLFAFRVRARFEAVVPSFVIFLFGAMLGTDRHRIGLTAAYLAAVLAFVVLADAGARSTTGAWFGTRGAQGDGAVLRAAAVVGLVAVLAGVVVGPRLPGADSPSLFGIGDQPGTRGAARVTVSPLVDIRGRLVNPSGAEVFTVGSPAPAYWRLTSLDRFDGTIWSSRGSYQRAKGSLPDGIVTSGPQQPLSGRTSSSAPCPPSGCRPPSVPNGSGARCRDCATSVTRAACSPTRTRPTASPTRSSRPARSPPRAWPTLPTGCRGRSPSATSPCRPTSPGRFAQAGEVIAGEPTPFAKARALQDWFRSEFTYSLDVAPGHGDDAIVAFLENRVGYCEQFAGTYAAMARAVGLPSRVAVGFTPGALGADGRYHVTDREAHAWPEVYITGYGWVAFEPTPGRGQPGAEDYTDVAPAEAETPATPDTTVPGAAGPAPGATTPAPADEQPAAVAVDEPGPSVVSRLLRVASFLLLLLPVAAVASVPLPAGRSADAGGWRPPRPPNGCWWRGTRRRRTWPSPDWASSGGRRPPSTRPGSVPWAATRWPATWACSPSTPTGGVVGRGRGARGRRSGGGGRRRPRHRPPGRRHSPPAGDLDPRPPAPPPRPPAGGRPAPRSLAGPTTG